MFSKHGGHKASVPEPCAHIDTAIEHAGPPCRRTSSDSHHSRPGPAQHSPYGPKQLRNQVLASNSQGSYTSPNPLWTDCTFIHRVEALDVRSYTCSFLQIAAACRRCTHASSMFSALAKSMYTLHWVVTVQKSCAKDMVVELSEYCRRMLSSPTFWHGKSERHACTRNPAARSPRPPGSVAWLPALAYCAMTWYRWGSSGAEGLVYMTIRFRPKTKINVCDGPQACSDTPVLCATANAQLVLPVLLAPRLGDSRRG